MIGGALGILEMAAGALLVLAVLWDVFLIVLYARTNTGIISRLVAHNLWRGFVAIGKRLGPEESKLLEFSGPVILLSVLGAWATLLCVGVALIIQPNLGTGIKAMQGQTPQDFVTALYVAGTSLAFVGAADFAPQSTPFQVLFLVTSLLGISMASLTITYLMQLYQNLLTRNAYGLQVQLLSGQTGDAAVLISQLAPEGRLEAGYNTLVDWAGRLPEVKESHAFYDMLFYFRFHEKYYSVSRTALVSLDTVALIQSGLDDKEAGWVKKTGAVNELGRGTMEELKTLTRVFLGRDEPPPPPDQERKALWRRRFREGVDTMAKAGLKVDKGGAERYVQLRSEWDGYIRQLAPSYAYDLDDIDPAMARVEKEQGKRE